MAITPFSLTTTLPSFLPLSSRSFSLSLRPLSLPSPLRLLSSSSLFDQITANPPPQPEPISSDELTQETETGTEKEKENEKEKEEKAVVELPRYPVPVLTVKERKELASFAHSLGKKLKSQQVGKFGVTPAVATSFVQTLEANELLKLKVHGNCPDDFLQAIKQLEESTGSVAVFQLGRTVILYRPSLSKMQKEADAKNNAAKRKSFRKPPRDFQSRGRETFRKPVEKEGEGSETKNEMIERKSVGKTWGNGGMDSGRKSWGGDKTKSYGTKSFRKTGSGGNGVKVGARTGGSGSRSRGSGSRSRP